MPPFGHTLEPVALPGEAVRLQPSGDVYLVNAVEQMAKIGPVDYGSASSGNSATESGSSIIDLDDELEMDAGTLGQFYVNPISWVDVEIRQTGQQEQRFVNSNQVGLITPNTPANQRVVYVHEQDAPHIIVTNNQTWDMAVTLVYYTGYVLHLSNRALSRDQVRNLSGHPATVPVDSLKQASPAEVGR